MQRLRQKLKKETASAHTALDENPSLQKYASASCDRDEYISVLRVFYKFYKSRMPASDNLSWKSYRHEYLSAIEEDLKVCGELPPEKRAELKEREIPYFYLLFGSSMGAKIILSRYEQSPWPRKHLEVAAKKGALLWREFLQELEKVPEKRHDDEVQKALRLFALLGKELPQ